MAQNRHSARHKSAAARIGDATAKELSGQAVPASQRGRANLSVDELAVRLVGGIVQSISATMDDSKGALEKEAWLWRVLAMNCEANAKFAEELAKGGRRDFCNGSRLN